MVGRSAHHATLRLTVSLIFWIIIWFGNETSAQTGGASNFTFYLSDTESSVIPVPNSWGLEFIPDGPVSYIHDDVGIHMWFSDGGTTLLLGSTFQSLAPFPLANGHAVDVFGPSATGFDSSYAGAYSIIRARNGNDLLMFYHAENHACGSFPFFGGIGLARSTDEGVTWQRRGQILSTAAPRPIDCNFQAWGVGNPTVYHSRDGHYLYMLFTEWLRGNPVYRPDELYLARALIESDGEPGSWKKYASGSFSQPGLGGLGTPVIGQPPPSGSTTIYAGLPSVSYNVALNRFIVIFQSRLGLHVATSEDGITWDTPRLIWQVGDIYVGVNQDTTWTAYPSLISLDQPTQETTDATGYLYFARGSAGNGRHAMARRRFEIKLIPTTVKSISSSNPDFFSISQNYPNPFNPSTTIRYGLPNRSHVTLTVFNTLGQQVATLVNGEQDAGYHEVTFEASGLASGVYFYRIQVGSFVQTKKLLLLR